MAKAPRMCERVPEYYLDDPQKMKRIVRAKIRELVLNYKAEITNHDKFQIENLCVLGCELVKMRVRHTKTGKMPKGFEAMLRNYNQALGQLIPKTATASSNKKEDDSLVDIFDE